MAAKEHHLIPATERAAHLIGLYLERQIAELRITQAEVHILAHLAKGGETSPNELHHLFGHKRSTLTSVLDRLEARGLTRRAINPDDRRSFIVSLTPPGKRAAATVAKAASALEQRIAARASGRDLDGFSATLAALEAEVAASADASAA
ncbi:MAG TPA: MarR family winged helix-turn-helix transcriptional regulator [Gaiellaceae bacterium]|jgi:DNA-binding MarR family transcriptional regulator